MTFPAPAGNRTTPAQRPRPDTGTTSLDSDRESTSMDSTMRRLASRPWIRFNDAGGTGGGSRTTSTQTGGDQTQQTSGTGQQDSDADKGFPANTPVAQMTVEQQLAYWKHHARKHETRANAAADYDEVVAERDRLKQERMTESERALAEAEARGRQAADADWAPRSVRAALTIALTSRGVKKDDVEDELSLINPTAFLTDKGEVDTDKVTKFLDRRAPAGKGPGTGSTPFGLGQTEQIRATGRDAGKAEAAKRFGTQQQ